MGNEIQSQRNETLDSLITNVKEEEISKMDDEKLVQFLYKIYRFFSITPTVFKNLKSKESKGEFDEESKKKQKSDNQEEEKNEITKSQKFRNILKDLLIKKIITNQIQSINKCPHISILILRLIRYLIQDNKDSIFIKDLMKNNFEELCGKMSLLGVSITNNYEIFRETCQLFNAILIYYMDMSNDNNNDDFENLDILLFSKMFFIFKKIDNDFEFYNVLEKFKVVITFLNTLIRYIYKIYIESKKKKHNYYKEKVEQLKIFFSDIYSISIFQKISGYFKIPRIENLIRDVDLIRKETEKRNKNKTTEEEEKKESNAEDILEKFNEEIKFAEKYINEETNEIDFNVTPPFIILEMYENIISFPFNFEERILKQSKIIETIYSFLVEDLYDVINGDLQRKKEELEKDKNNNTKDRKQEISFQLLRRQYYYALSEKISTVLVKHFINFIQYDSSENDYLPFLNINSPNFYRDTSNIFEFISFFTEQEIDPEIKDERIKKYGENFKFSLCVYLYCLCISDNIWKIFLGKKYHLTINQSIILYIKKTFRKGEDPGPEEQRLKKLELLIDFLSFITSDKIHVKIKHAELFSTMLSIPALLFYINYPSFRRAVLKILNVFVLFQTCKQMLISEPYRNVCNELYERINISFDKLRQTDSETKQINKNLEEIEKEFIEYENDYEEFKKKKPKEGFQTNKIIALDEQCKKQKMEFQQKKEDFISQFNEFGLLISIFVNLMIQKNYDAAISILCGNNFENVKNFFYFEELDEHIAYFKKTESLNGKFFVFYSFFKNDCFQRAKLFNELNIKENNYLKYFIIQIALAIFIHLPELYIYLDENIVIDNPENINLITLIKIFKENIRNYEMLPKILFALIQFFKKKNKLKEISSNVKALIKDIRGLLELDNLPLYVAREIYKFLNNILLDRDDCVLWMKLDIKKFGIDSTNTNAISIKMGNKEGKEQIDTRNHSLLLKDQNPLNSRQYKEMLKKNGKMIPLPYMRVEPYKQSMGIITYDKHYFELINTLNLSSTSDHSYTISFFFYNPVICLKDWHVLVQDESGYIPLIAIDQTGNRIGCFDVQGNFIDSGLNLGLKIFKNKWLHFALVYDSKTVDGTFKLSGEVGFYLNGVKTTDIDIEGKKLEVKIYHFDKINGKSEISLGKIVLPNTVKYIGNGSDFKHPFGPFCDLRIFRGAKKPRYIQRLLKFHEPKFKSELEFVDYHKIVLEGLGETITNYILNTPTIGEEVMLFLTKFLNIILSRNNLRHRFLNFRLIVKLSKEGLSYENLDNKKEITKFLKTIA